ncbi:universal stress protein [Desulfococcaceae bacterium HSG9]|nr:universal stress protein [Desulfococcaceae bacterium HSG9]
MFKKILVPIDVDYPETAAAVLNKTAEHVKPMDAEIRLVSVMSGFGMPIVASYIPKEVRQAATDRFKESLEQFTEANCDKSVSYCIRTGKAWEEIIKEAEKWGADLIVVYHNHRGNLNESFSVSCSHRVADHANCSVLRLRNILS